MKFTKEEDYMLSKDTGFLLEQKYLFYHIRAHNHQVPLSFILLLKLLINFLYHAHLTYREICKLVNKTNFKDFFKN